MFLDANPDDPNSSSQFIELIRRSSSSASMPDANAPPTRPPMLVPAATSIGIRCSSNHRITPMWARPRALPPPKATPTTGLSCTGARSRRTDGYGCEVALATGACRSGAAQPAASITATHHSATHTRRQAARGAGVAILMSRGQVEGPGLRVWPGTPPSRPMSRRPASRCSTKVRPVWIIAVLLPAAFTRKRLAFRNPRQKSAAVSDPLVRSPPGAA